MSSVRLFTALVAPVLAAAALGVISMPAQADTIVTNQWYSATFNPTVGSPLLVSPIVVGTNGPILPSGTANALAAPGTPGTNLSAVITLPNGGFLTATDNGATGDQFMMDVNGIGATAAVGNPSGLTPGGQQAVGSKTSVPVFSFVNCGSDISSCLSNPDFSSGTFALPAGPDTISGTVVAVFGATGFMDFIVEPKPTTIPEPATWLLLSSALLGFGIVRRRTRTV
jgi:hypothetical protein